MNPRLEFYGKVEFLGAMGGFHVIYLPPDIVEQLPAKKGSHLRVECEINEIPFQRALHSLRGKWYLIVSKQFMKKAEIMFGDRVEVSFRVIDSDIVEIPTELSDRLESDRIFKKAWDKLTPGKRRSHAFVVSKAKMPETKQKRIDAIVEELKGLA